jgi:hypothetical protein
MVSPAIPGFAAAASTAVTMPTAMTVTVTVGAAMPTTMIGRIRDRIVAFGGGQHQRHDRRRNDGELTAIRKKATPRGDDLLVLFLRRFHLYHRVPPVFSHGTCSAERSINGVPNRIEQ